MVQRPPLPPGLSGSERPLLGALDGSDAVSASTVAKYAAAAVAERNKRSTRRNRDVAASSSFFGLPRGWSSGSLRARMRLPPAPPGTVDWVSIAVVYWVTLVSEASRGLMMPSTWPYLSSLGGSKTMLGVFVATFSVGRMATTIPMGYISDKSSTSAVLAVASVIQILGHILYAVAPTVWALLIARIVVGFGSATMSVCRAHLTRAVPARVRTHHFAYLSALQFVGFAVLPGAGGLLAQLPEVHIVPAIGLVLNGYTYPAWVLVFCNLVAIFLIYGFYFNPPTRAEMAAAAQAAASNRPQAYGATQSVVSNAASNEQDEEDQPRADMIALLVCLLTNLAFRGIVAELEVVATPFLIEQFGITYAESSYYITMVGFLGLFVYLFFKPIAHRFSDRNLVLVGLGFVMLGTAPLAISWFTRAMSLTTYMVCIGAIWSIAYPVGQTAVLALFSKVLADLPAGGFLGIFSASGSLARIVFAMVAGKTWQALGREAVFACILGYIAPALVLCLWAYRRLVPKEDAI